MKKLRGAVPSEVDSVFSRVLVLGLMLMVSGPLWALGKIRITSDVPAYVELKGQKLGDAPLTLHDLKRGTYELVITAFESGETKTYKVSIPGKGAVTRNVGARFGESLAERRTQAEATAAREARIAARYASRSGQGQPSRLALGALAASEVSLGAPLPAPERSRTAKLVSAARSRWNDRHTQRHIVSGGVALLGAAVGSGVIAGLGLGGVVMNEIVHRDRDTTHSRATSHGWGPAPGQRN